MQKLYKQVEEGKRNGGSHAGIVAPNANPAAVAEYNAGIDPLEALDARVLKIDREVQRPEEQAHAAETKARCAKQIKALTAQRAALSVQRQEALAASNAARDAQATALLSDTTSTADPAQHDQRADLLQRAINQLGAAIAEAQGKASAIAEQVKTLKGEQRRAHMLMTEEAYPGRSCQLPPFLAARQAATRKAHGWGAVEQVDIQLELRLWLDAQPSTSDQAGAFAHRQKSEGPWRCRFDARVRRGSALKSFSAFES